VVEHAAHHRVETLLDRGGQLLEGLERAAARAACPAAQFLRGLLCVVVLPGAGVDLAQRQARAALSAEGCSQRFCEVVDRGNPPRSSTKLRPWTRPPAQARRCVSA